MNYYEHHIGDFLKATAHLSMLEDSAYRRLIDSYYTRELPLPVDRKACHKLARAHSEEEREAVDYVLDEYFRLEEDGWHQNRCDQEIATYHDSQVGKDGRRDNEAERQRRHRAERSKLFEALRGHGVVMPYNANMSQLRNELSRVTGNGSNANEATDATATQTPVPNTQTVVINDDSNLNNGVVVESLAEKHKSLQARANELAIMLRQRGAQLQSSDPNVLEWASSGVTDAQALSALETAKQNRAAANSTQSISASYLNSIIANAAKPKNTKEKFKPHSVPPASAHTADAERNNSGLDMSPEAVAKRWEGIE